MASTQNSEPRSPVNGPPRLPPPTIPHVYVEKGLGTAKTEKK
jgi:hypothetical protein